MKTIITVLVIIRFTLNFSSVNAAYIDSATINNENKISAEKHFFKNAVIEKMIGRKLSLSEKLGILLNKKKLKRRFENPLDARANKDAKLGFWLSIVGIFLLYSLIPGYIFSKKALDKEKEKPGSLTLSNLRLAQIGKGICNVIGVLLLLSLFLTIVLLVLLLSR